MTHRSYGLDYQGALAKDLPMGWGEIESAHRYLFQKRLKIAGAWWKAENLAKGWLCASSGPIVAGRITGQNVAKKRRDGCHL
jgi:hypothetical protein